MFRFFGAGVSAEIFWLVLVFGQLTGRVMLLVCFWIDAGSGPSGTVHDLDEVRSRSMIQR